MDGHGLRHMDILGNASACRDGDDHVDPVAQRDPDPVSDRDAVRYPDRDANADAQ